MSHILFWSEIKTLLELGNPNLLTLLWRFCLNSASIMNRDPISTDFYNHEGHYSIHNEPFSQGNYKSLYKWYPYDG